MMTPTELDTLVIGLTDLPDPFRGVVDAVTAGRLTVADALVAAKLIRGHLIGAAILEIEGRYLDCCEEIASLEKP